MTSSIPRREFPVFALLLIGNCVLSALAVFAFFLVLFNRNNVMAMGPGLLVLPGILLQPWMIAFIFVPFGCFIAPAAGSLITWAVYRWLASKGHMNRPRGFISRIPAGRLRLFCLGYFALASIILYCGYIDVFSLHRGIPVRMAYLLGPAKSRVSDGRFYFMNDFIDSEYVWMGTVPAEGWYSIVTELGMRPVELRDMPRAFPSMPPYWWRFHLSDGMVAYSTEHFPAGRGGDGLHAYAVWDQPRQIVRIWFKDNF